MACGRGPDNKSRRAAGGDVVRRPLYWLVALSALSSFAHAGQSFNPAFLSNDPSRVADLSRFEGSDSILPGSYRVDLYVNGTLLSTRDVAFKSTDETANSVLAPVTPCFSPADFKSFNLDPIVVPTVLTIVPGTCSHLESLITGASSTLNQETLRLDVSIPQALMARTARGYVPVEEWDHGINAFLLNYNLSGSHTQGNYSRDNYFLSLNSGLNLGAWRLRNSSTLTDGVSHRGGRQRDWKTIESYALRPVPHLRSSMMLGESNIPGTIFDSVPFKGARVASDDSMLADSERGFAPVVRGIAKSNAEVVIRQNGNIIHQAYVSPGAFLIDDLFPSHSNGDLHVSVMEADGSVNQFTVPYSSVPLLQREGRFKYDVTVGRYRGGRFHASPGFIQSTFQWGLPAGVTVYGGSQNARDYTAFLVGMGQNLGGWGAVSFDLTHAESRLANDSRHEGQSARLLYAKTLNATGTSFRLAGYQYSTQGFYTFNEAARNKMRHISHYELEDEYAFRAPLLAEYFNLDEVKRSHAQFNVSQPLSIGASLYASARRQTYWHNSKTSDLVQLGAQTQIGGVGYNLSYNYSKNLWSSRPDQMFSLGVTVPLGNLISSGGYQQPGTSRNGLYASYGLIQTGRGESQQDVGLSGTLLEQGNLSYGMQQSYNDQSHASSSSVSGNYRGGQGSVSLGYSDNGHGSRLNYGLAGGAVLHEHGLTLSQSLGDTNILIRAPGASGVTVPFGSGIVTDYRGYAVQPNASVYRNNRVALDVNTLGRNVELDTAVTRVVPTRGALVRAEFAVRSGARALVSLSFKGKPIPFGALVTHVGHPDESIVADNGQVFLSGLPAAGELNIWWSDQAEGSCKARYVLPDDAETRNISKFAAECG